MSEHADKPGADNETPAEAGTEKPQPSSDAPEATRRYPAGFVPNLDPIPESEIPAARRRFAEARRKFREGRDERGRALPQKKNS